MVPADCNTSGGHPRNSRGAGAVVEVGNYVMENYYEKDSVEKDAFVEEISGTVEEE
jgi:hypothetical protein